MEENAHAGIGTTPRRANRDRRQHPPDYSRSERNPGADRHYRPARGYGGSRGGLQPPDRVDRHVGNNAPIQVKVWLEGGTMDNTWMTTLALTILALMGM